MRYPGPLATAAIAAALLVPLTQTAATPTAADNTLHRRATAERLCAGESRDADHVPGTVLAALEPGSPACRALAAESALPSAVRNWIDPGARRTLSFDALMGDARPAPSQPAAAPTADLFPTPTRSPPPALDLLVAAHVADPSRGELSLDTIEAGREAVKVVAAQERVRAIGDRLDAACACVAGGSCFRTPSFEHAEMNAAIADQAGTYEAQARELCGQWSPSMLEVLPDDRGTLAEIEQHLQLLHDTKSQMHVALEGRVGEFRAEETRIRRAIADAEAARARAEAEALAQADKKRSGFLAGVLSLGAGAVLADSLGMELDPEALARTSVGVSRAVANGEGLAGAIGAGVQGFDAMARTAVPKFDVPSAPAGGGDMYADAMAHVKKFPEPGSAVAGAAPGAVAAPASQYADMFAAVGGAGAAPMPDGLSADAIAAGNAALQHGADLVASGVTPGGPGVDAFGVREPTTERFEFGCKVRSNIPLSDGAGGVKYYYERKISGVINYWTPACGPAYKAYYIAYACNNIDDFARVEADCVSACGARDCRDTKYENSVLGGGS